MTREELLQHFLDKNGWGNAHHKPLASDASLRTYDRLTQNGRSTILMNSPLSENPDKFVFFDELLAKTGIRVPKILAKDMDNGFILLEDFGDNTFTKLLNGNADEYTLYKMGIDTLIKLQKNIIIPTDGIETYTDEQMLNGVMLLPNWFGKYVLPKGLPEQAVQSFKTIWEKLIKKIESSPKTLVLLDYHVDNLMITPDNECGVLDFQDARLGPIGYDLMSLLEDERRDVSKETRGNLTDYYFKQMPEWNTPDIRETLPIVAMQRHTRVIGLFVRLFLRDKKEKYLKMIPFIWELTERNLNNPLFQDYKDWLDTYIPPAFRKKNLTQEDFNAQ